MTSPIPTSELARWCEEQALMTGHPYFAACAKRLKATEWQPTEFNKCRRCDKTWTEHMQLTGALMRFCDQDRLQAFLLPRSTQAGEPVAWRWRWRECEGAPWGEWHVTDKKPVRGGAKYGECMETQSLVPAPWDT